MTVSELVAKLKQIQGLENQALALAETYAPQFTIEEVAADALFHLISQLVVVALQAYSEASQAPITAESILALLPNPATLSEPDA